MTLTIDLGKERYEQLAELARQHGLSAEEFARREIDMMLDRQAAFDRAAEYVLKKNAELYRRLAQ